MGDEIQKSDFTSADFEKFETALKEETTLLRSWFNNAEFEDSPAVLGYELEAWCMDKEFQPAPRNEEFLDAFANSMVVEELARFNVEFNAPPEPLGASTLQRVNGHLQELWSDATKVAHDLDMRLAMIGILPTAQQSQLSLENMSNRERYRALNREVLRMRHNKSLHLDIKGREHLICDQRNVMLESAATSLQIHVQINQHQAADYYNAAQALAAPMVAATSNSPFLFGFDLWAETRIPLFEQAVNTVDGSSRKYAAPARVTFGDDYIRKSLLEMFVSNLESYPVLLPANTKSAPKELCHLRLHNGTIWRWNRPLVGFSDAGVPHLRLEHRVIPAGPSIPDIVANIALFAGLLHSVVRKHGNIARYLPFEHARDNFYNAARDGLDATLKWFDDRRGGVDSLLLEVLIPAAREGLLELAVDSDDVAFYMDIIERRVRLRRTGSDWQRGYVQRCGRDMTALAQAYYEAQQSGRPVCEWEF